ncbi:hypothetical protein [Pseudomonas quasicaspiana]|uniref:hypothetical protein n=1 Tax=Pseudomonas quasicaspiana TaxID=2829821 RepID=UPI001E3E8727|nr:hypothetical protein [Pseudomonas quasicaspiana]MCD5977035.1 hypothetical protein [Pseudomonas quasicaspiana]
MQRTKSLASFQPVPLQLAQPLGDQPIKNDKQRYGLRRYQYRAFNFRQILRVVILEYTGHYDNRHQRREQVAHKDSHDPEEDSPRSGGMVDISGRW